VTRRFWVFIEQENGKPHQVSWELIGVARRLAGEIADEVAATGEEVLVEAVVVGKDVKSVAEEALKYGPDHVYIIEGDVFSHYRNESYSKALVEIVQKYKPEVFFIGATTLGRDLAGAVATKLGTGLTADCTKIEMGAIKEGGPKLLLATRPAFGGNIIATIINYDRWPQMATVREGVMPMPIPDGTRKAAVVKETVHLSHSDLAVEILSEHVQQKKVNLKASRVVVAGGAGVGSKDNFRLIWDLANCLGGAPGATRAAVDLGFIDRDHQVGQTGTTVRPSLYIAIGISGAIQHQAGMADSQKIIAINNDPDAPIFNIAHYKIVGDLNQVVPMMIKAIKEKV